MIYVLTGGEYSDYAVTGMFEGPPGVDVNELAVQYGRLFPDQAEDYKLVDDRFRAWVLETAVLKEVPHDELYLGPTGSLREAIEPYPSLEEFRKMLEVGREPEPS